MIIAGIIGAAVAAGVVSEINAIDEQYNREMRSVRRKHAAKMASLEEGHRRRMRSYDREIAVLKECSRINKRHHDEWMQKHDAAMAANEAAFNAFMADPNEETLKKVMTSLDHLDEVGRNAPCLFRP